MIGTIDRLRTERLVAEEKARNKDQFNTMHGWVMAQYWLETATWSQIDDFCFRCRYGLPLPGLWICEHLSGDVQREAFIGAVYDARELVKLPDPWD